MQFLNKLLFLFNKLDWFAGGTLLVVGLYLQNWWLVAGGVTGLLSAYFQPAAWLSQRLQEKILAKGVPLSENGVLTQEDEFYAQHLGAPILPTEPAQDSNEPRMLIWNTPHNQLTREALVLYPADRSAPTRQFV